MDANKPEDGPALQKEETIKLWLDYLAKLNDRSARQDQLSGMTAWVLISLIAVLLYKGVPALSSIIEDQQKVRSAEVFFFLGLNFAVAALLAYRGFLNFAGRSRQSDITIRDIIRTLALLMAAFSILAIVTAAIEHRLLHHLSAELTASTKIVLWSSFVLSLLLLSVQLLFACYLTYLKLAHSITFLFSQMSRQRGLSCLTLLSDYSRAWQVLQ